MGNEIVSFTAAVYDLIDVLLADATDYQARLAELQRRYRTFTSKAPGATDAEARDQLAAELVRDLKDKNLFGRTFLPQLYKVNEFKLDREQINLCCLDAAHLVLSGTHPRQLFGRRHDPLVDFLHKHGDKRPAGKPLPPEVVSDQELETKSAAELRDYVASRLQLFSADALRQLIRDNERSQGRVPEPQQQPQAKAKSPLLASRLFSSIAAAATRSSPAQPPAPTEQKKEATSERKGKAKDEQANGGSSPRKEAERDKAKAKEQGEHKTIAPLRSSTPKTEEREKEKEKDRDKEKDKDKDTSIMRLKHAESVEQQLRAELAAAREELRSSVDREDALTDSIEGRDFKKRLRELMVAAADVSRTLVAELQLAEQAKTIKPLRAHCSRYAARGLLFDFEPAEALKSLNVSAFRRCLVRDGVSVSVPLLCMVQCKSSSLLVFADSPTARAEGSQMMSGRALLASTGSPLQEAFLAWKLGDAATLQDRLDFPDDASVLRYLQGVFVVESRRKRQASIGPASGRRSPQPQQCAWPECTTPAAANALCTAHQQCHHTSASLSLLFDGKEIVRALPAAFAMADTLTHGLAIRVAWQLLLGSYPRSTAAEQWAGLITSHLAGANFSEHALNALVGVLLDSEAAVDQPLRVAFYTPVVNPEAWSPLLSCLEACDFSLRARALEVVSTLLFNCAPNCASLSAVDGFQELLFALLVDVPKLRDHVLEQVHAFTLNILAQLLLSAFFFAKPGQFEALLRATLARLHAFAGYCNETCALATSLFYALFTKLAKNCAVLAAEHAAVVAWDNTLALLECARRFIFQTRFWKTKGVQRAPNITGKQSRIATLERGFVSAGSYGQSAAERERALHHLASSPRTSAMLSAGPHSPGLIPAPTPSSPSTPFSLRAASPVPSRDSPSPSPSPHPPHSHSQSDDDGPPASTSASASNSTARSPLPPQHQRPPLAKMKTMPAALSPRRVYSPELKGIPEPSPASSVSGGSSPRSPADSPRGKQHGNLAAALALAARAKPASATAASASTSTTTSSVPPPPSPLLDSVMPQDEAVTQFLEERAAREGYGQQASADQMRILRSMRGFVCTKRRSLSAFTALGSEPQIQEFGLHFDGRGLHADERLIVAIITFLELITAGDVASSSSDGVRAKLAEELSFFRDSKAFCAPVTALIIERPNASGLSYRKLATMTQSLVASLGRGAQGKEARAALVTELNQLCVAARSSVEREREQD